MQAHETFASDHAFNRYTNDNLDLLGRNRHEQSITCRSLMTDKTNHYYLKDNHAKNDYYSQYAGFWNDGQNRLSDVGNFEHIAFEVKISPTRNGLYGNIIFFRTTCEWRSVWRGRGSAPRSGE